MPILKQAWSYMGPAGMCSTLRTAGGHFNDLYFVPHASTALLVLILRPSDVEVLKEENAKLLEHKISRSCHYNAVHTPYSGIFSLSSALRVGLKFLPVIVRPGDLLKLSVGMAYYIVALRMDNFEGHGSVTYFRSVSIATPAGRSSDDPTLCMCEHDNRPSGRTTFGERFKVSVVKMTHLCKVCGLNCKSHAELLRHYELHDIVWTCVRCSKNYSSESAATRHFRNRHDDRTFTCSSCFPARVDFPQRQDLSNMSLQFIRRGL